MSERKTLCATFSVEEHPLDSLNPGDMFFDGNTLWVAINRHSDGYLVKLAGTQSSRGTAMSGDTKVFYCISCNSSLINEE